MTLTTPPRTRGQRGGGAPVLGRTQRVPARDPALPTGKTRRGRLEFLDALRGVAALSVVVQHGGEFLWRSYFRWSEEWFRPGEFGVVLFFLCSGYIIPASLERHGSLRRFWIGRFFRLFPLYWTVLLMALVLHALHGTSLPPGEFFQEHGAVVNTLANVTMLQEFLAVPLILGQSWSLAYELSFYTITSLLFLAGWHKRSVPLAGAGLVVTLLAGNLVRPVWLTLPMGDRAHLLILIAAALGVLVGCFVGGSPARRVIAGLLTTAVVLLTTNAPAPLWFSMLLMTTMFVGTVLCRYGKGEVSGRAAAAVYGGALAVIVAVHVLRVSPQLLPIAGAGNAHVTRIHPEIPTFLAAYLVFGAGLLARRCRFPRILIWFGTISYSLYLMHAVVMYHVPWWGADKALTMIRWVALSIAVSALTYYIVEKPGIALGHRVADRLGPTRRRAEQSSYATAG